MFYILQIWTLVCFAYMILQAVGKMPGCFSRDLEDKIQKYIWGSANGLCTPQVKFFYLVLLILNSTIAQSCNILLPFLTIFFCHIRTNSVKFDFFILWMKMDSLMLSQFDMWILATNKWWAPLYFNTILICCYLFPLELPLNIRRKDPRKTMNMVEWWRICWLSWLGRWRSFVQRLQVQKKDHVHRWKSRYTIVHVTIISAVWNLN
jgi:hypothetical protein